MRLTAGRAGKGLAIVALGLSPLAVHAVLTTDEWAPFAVGVPLLQLLTVAWLALDRRVSWYKWLIAASACPLLVIALGRSVDLGLIAASAIPHTLAYAFLLAVFGGTLRPGRQAFVTALALKVHRSVPHHVLAYTRRVTWAWCAFFAVQLVVSLLLFVFAPLATWSLFVNVLNMPLLVAMFVGEYVYRLVRIPDSPRHDWQTIQSMFSHLRTDVAQQAKTKWSAT